MKLPIYTYKWFTHRERDTHTYFSRLLFAFVIEFAASITYILTDTISLLVEAFVTAKPQMKINGK